MGGMNGGVMEKAERGVSNEKQNEDFSVRENGYKASEDGGEKTVLTREEMGDLGRKVLETGGWQEELGFWSKEYRGIEEQFGKYRKENEGGAGYFESLRRYEDDLVEIWERVEEASAEGLKDGRLASKYEWADEQDIAAVDPRESIEGATGAFFGERSERLMAEILGSENGDRSEDRGFVRQTWSKVMNYIEATHDYELLREDYRSYQETRRDAHNTMIRQLNGLNELAERYGCKRFTVRNFMTNDFRYERMKDVRGRLDARAEYDRESVATYFRTAFAKDFRDSEIRSQRKDI